MIISTFLKSILDSVSKRCSSTRLPRLQSSQVTSRGDVIPINNHNSKYPGLDQILPSEPLPNKYPSYSVLQPSGSMHTRRPKDYHVAFMYSKAPDSRVTDRLLIRIVTSVLGLTVVKCYLNIGLV